MSCCFKAQKEKYEFGGGLGPDGPENNVNKKQSARAKKRHSKILMNELPQSTPQNEDTIHEEAQPTKNDENLDNNANSITVPNIIINSPEESGETDTTTHSNKERDTIQKQDTDHTSKLRRQQNISPDATKRLSNTRSSLGNSESLRNSKNIDDDAKDKGDMQASKAVEDSNNNSIKDGKVLVVTKSSATSKRNNLKEQNIKQKNLGLSDKKGENVIRSSSNIEHQRNVRSVVKKKDSNKKKVDGSKVNRRNMMDGDAYKDSPAEGQKFEDWREENDDQDLPPPDYSDSEPEGDKEEDYVAMRKNVKNRISAILTREEWEKIVDKAGSSPEDEDEVEIPEPDYEGAPSKNRPLGRSHTFNVGGSTENTQQKKLLLMPGMDSKARQDIHRELMMNQKMGIDVLHQKSEFKKELDRRKDREKAKMKEQPRKNSFEIKLQEMANKVNKSQEDNNNKQDVIKEEDESAQPEFLRIHSKIIKSKSGS